MIFDDDLGFGFFALIQGLGVDDTNSEFFGHGLNLTVSEQGKDSAAMIGSSQHRHKITKHSVDRPG